ncbi:MAG: hypothetical protein JXB26_08625 [Candidatus Aminicenantes bacterium]|nr:hypothetical protein [Candidatus Aminicenantes bacterium]
MRKSKMLFSLGLCLSFWAMALMNLSLPASGAYAALQKTLKEGTPVALSLTQSIDSDMVTMGENVEFVVSRDVEVDGRVVIQAGTRATGTVASVEQRGMLGKPGAIMVTLKSTTAVDGTQVPLRGTISREGKNKQTTALLIGILLCILGLFLIKGGSAMVPSGTEVKAYVDYSVQINI